MSSAVFDRLDSLLEEEKSNARSSWLELVNLYVDGGEDDEILRRFRESGRSRKELERDADLLQEQRSLEYLLASAPQLEMEAAELGEKFSAAMREKEAVEEALKQALVNVSKADSAHTTANNFARHARRAKQELDHPRFAFLKGGERMTANGSEISREIALVEGKLEALAAKIHESKSKLSRYDAEWAEVNARDEKTEVKNVERNKLQAGIEGTNSLIDRYSAEEHDLRKELRSLRNELAAEKSQSQSQWSQW